MLREIAPLLRQLPESVTPYTTTALADYFGLPEAHFVQRTSKSPIQFHQGGLVLSAAYQLRGTIFWPSDSQITRGYPRVLASSDYTSEPYAVAVESAMFDALAGHEGVIEVKEPGVSLRLYYRAGKLHFATDATIEGGNPITRAGIVNARALGIDYASQARRILEANYRNAAALVRLGYVAVFELLLPERESAVPVERPDLVLIDVIDPDYCIVDRLEKERIAEDYGLRVVTLHGRMQGAATPAEFYSRLRSLEHIAARDDVAGYVLKVPWNHDQLALKIEPPGIRQAWTSIDESDLESVYDAVLTDFGSAGHLRPPLDKPAFLIEAMLDYIGEHDRSVRWQVHAWLSQRSTATVILDPPG